MTLYNEEEVNELLEQIATLADRVNFGTDSDGKEPSGFKLYCGGVVGKDGTLEYESYHIHFSLKR